MLKPRGGDSKRSHVDMDFLSQIVYHNFGSDQLNIVCHSENDGRKWQPVFMVIIGMSAETLN